MKGSAARALRESEELHRITLINMSDAVFITDDDGRFTYVCPNVDVIFGYGPEEARGLATISRLLGRELVDRARLAADGEIRNIEHEVSTRDGDRRALLVHIKQVAIKGGTTLYVCRDITERKQSELMLRRNEERLTLALESANMGMWDWHVPTGEMNWSPETYRLFGDSTHAQPPSFESFLDRVHPVDRDRVSRAMSGAMEQGASYETEFRVRGFDDRERWVMGKGTAVRNGKPLRMIGVFIDFTERHRSEQERRELGGRLINAHEQERIRVSRELHDGISQRLTLLAAEIGVLRQRLGPMPGEIRDLVERTLAQAAELGLELHRLSHDLHPARLEQLGLEASLRSLCREFADAHPIAVTADIDDVPATMSADVTLCLYRIAQEALQNVLKHSGATEVAVKLAASRAGVVLSVTDNGSGFDPSIAPERPALGLVSMRERARLVGGEIGVTSRPGGGTHVELRVPREGN